MINNFEFKTDLSFTYESPFAKFSRLSYRGRDFIKNNDFSFYDGPDNSIRGGILLNNSCDRLKADNNIINSELSLLMPIIDAAIDFKLPVCIKPQFIYHDRMIGTETIELAYLPEFNSEIEIFYDDAKNMLIRLTQNGLNKTPQYKIGLYQIFTSPIIYNPITFVPEKRVFLRYFKYE